MKNTKLAICILSTAVVFAASLEATASADVIGYWRFEEGVAGNPAAGASSILDSAFSNHGSPQGDPIYSSDVAVSPIPLSGLANNLSLGFDGTDNTVLIATNAVLDGGGSFTVEFWMRSADTTSGQKLLVDKSHGFGDFTGWFFQSRPDTGFVDFGIGNGFPVVTSQAEIFDDQWHHLAGTYDGNQTEFFVDGVSQGTNVVGAYLTNMRDIRIGSARNNGRFFNGNIDELRISDTVLARSQFLNIPEPSSAVILGLAGINLILRRKRAIR